MGNPVSVLANLEKSINENALLSDDIISVDQKEAFLTKVTEFMWENPTVHLSALGSAEMLGIESVMTTGCSPVLTVEKSTKKDQVFFEVVPGLKIGTGQTLTFEAVTTQLESARQEVASGSVSENPKEELASILSLKNGLSASLATRKPLSEHSVKLSGQKETLESQLKTAEADLDKVESKLNKDVVIEITDMLAEITSELEGVTSELAAIDFRLRKSNGNTPS